MLSVLGVPPRREGEGEAGDEEEEEDHRHHDHQHLGHHGHGLGHDGNFDCDLLDHDQNQYAFCKDVKLSSAPITYKKDSIREAILQEKCSFFNIDLW